MKAIISIIFVLMAFKTEASNVNFTTVKSCPNGLEIQHLESWGNGNYNSRFFISLSGNALQSINEQLGSHNQSNVLEHFEVMSNSWGEFSGIISTGNVFASEVNDGRAVALKIENKNGFYE